MQPPYFGNTGPNTKTLLFDPTGPVSNHFGPEFWPFPLYTPLQLTNITAAAGRAADVYSNPHDFTTTLFR